MNMHESFDPTRRAKPGAKSRTEKIRRGPTGTVIRKAEKADRPAKKPEAWVGTLADALEPRTEVIQAEKTDASAAGPNPALEEWEPETTDADVEKARVDAYAAVNARNGTDYVPEGSVIYPKPKLPEIHLNPEVAAYEAAEKSGVPLPDLKPLPRLRVVEEDGYQHRLLQVQSKGRWLQDRVSSLIKWVKYGSERDIGAY